MLSSSSTSPSRKSSLLDLEILEIDPAPTFVLKVSAQVTGFDFLYCNEAFRRAGLHDTVLAHGRDGLLFRSWAQAVSLFKPSMKFADRIWTADLTGVSENWKVVRATAISLEDGLARENKSMLKNRSQTRQPSRDLSLKRPDSKRDPTIASQDYRTDVHARLESLQTMMDMSDVGVFEYEPSGKLIHANDAWYKLSNHSRDLFDHVEFSFMDIAHPGDYDVIMSAWNTLLQGNPITFEMRWKAKHGSSKSVQWVLSACVTVLDEDRNLISIVGNTIDISMQKESAEAAQAKVEALEQARLSEEKFARFAELAPIAIYIYNPNKGLQYVNDQFFELTDTPRKAPEEVDLSGIIVEDDVDRVMAEWAAIMQAKKLGRMEYRLKRTWGNQEGVCSNTWVQVCSYPELDELGNVVSVMGTMFDISHFKWAESAQRQRFEEALEAKRQQGNFIDMTSHELRNPLSAIVQCADSVLTTLRQLSHEQLDNSHRDIQKVNDEITTCVESIQTIISCSLHQKRIIDDVLTLSKLDSKLLLITPIAVQPVVVVSEAMKMFEAECQQMHIALKLRKDESLKGFEWVMLDPSRMLQILLNLITNAIKFTKDRETRAITVTLGGSWTRPSAKWQTVTFANNGLSGKDVCDKPGWGTGSKGFIWFKVDDTGCGMTENEQKKLFHRFTQATPRTHIMYGGSGLGLFISKSLAALQGGSIGVSSEANSGSTFAFYVATRVACGPEKTDAGNSQRFIAQNAVAFEDAMKAASLQILVVEDNIVNQKVLSKQLQNAGCVVSVAGNGVEALEMLKMSVYWHGQEEDRRVLSESAQPGSTDNSPQNVRMASTSLREFDIILMDIEMPVMDGLTCTKQVREYEQQGLLSRPETPPRPKLPRQMSNTSASPITLSPETSIPEHPVLRPRILRLPILAVSANARSEQVEQALSAGMDDSISKPFRIAELWPKMANLVPRCSSITS